MRISNFAKPNKPKTVINPSKPPPIANPDTPSSPPIPGVLFVQSPSPPDPEFVPCCPIFPRNRPLLSTNGFNRPQYNS